MILKKIFLFTKLTQKEKIILIKNKKNLKTFDMENLGAEFYKIIKDIKSDEYSINSDSILNSKNNFLEYFLHGIKLKSYEFNKYKTKKNSKTIQIFVIGNKNQPSLKRQLRFKALEEGTFLQEIWFLNQEIFYTQMNMQKD